MRRTVGIVLAGSPGSGKTATMCSYYRPDVEGTTKRLVVDMESRAIRFQSQAYGKETDDPSRLLFVFNQFPGSDGELDYHEFIKLYNGINKGELDIDVLMLDNIVLFQGELLGWCQDKDVATEIAKSMGVAYKFNKLLNNGWKTADPTWWQLVKTIIKEFLLTLRRKGIDFVGTTEMKNLWSGYGTSSMKILGKSASLLDPWLQICDTVWNLTRKLPDGTLQDTPRISLDMFNPKNSIMGIPPKFEFTGWAKIWEWEKARVIPTKADMQKLEVPTIELPEQVEESGSTDQPVVKEPVAAVKPTDWKTLVMWANSKGRSVWLEAKTMEKQGIPWDKALEILSR